MALAVMPELSFLLPDEQASNVMSSENSSGRRHRSRTAPAACAVALLAATLALLSAPGTALGAPCAAEDFATRVSGESECLLMRRYGPTEPKTMIVWLHGNVSTGGPANSHFRVAEKVAADFAADRVLSVALVRPGYPDGTGAYSSGNDYGRADNWPREVIAEIGKVIARLRQKFRPDTVIIAGHSGGAAIAAVLLGMEPQLAEGALLIGCPCDMLAWRMGRSRTPWTSEDPLDWTGQVSPRTRVIALTGSEDVTTAPALARAYVGRLRARGIAADFQRVPDAGHIDVLKSPAIAAALSRLRD